MSHDASPPKRAKRTPIRRRSLRPRDYRELHEPVAETDKAVRFRYYAWLIWIPRSALVKVGDVYTAPPWAIDSAKEHASARHYRDDAEAREVSAEIRGVGPVERGSVLTASRPQSRS
jgi:hypothetical protein